MKSVFVLALCVAVALAEIPSIPVDVGSDFNPRIIHGEDAGPGEYPYIVSLRRESTGRHSCGASVLTPTAVLTAAHCCVDLDKFVVAGSYLLDGTGQVVGAASYAIHNQYNPDDLFANDICIIKLEKALELNNLVEQVTLPPRDYAINDGDLQTIVGWGLTVAGGTTAPNNLQVGRNFEGLSSQTCRQLTGVNVFAGNVCARGEEKGQAVCNGDSGSPLVARDGFQTGIASFVFTPCGSGYPDFYVRVSHYIDWIQQQLGADAKLLRFAQV